MEASAMLQAVPRSIQEEMPENLSHAVESFILAKRVEGHAKGTLAWYGFLLKELVQDVGPDTRLATITTADVRKHLGRLESEGLARTSLANQQRVVKTFLRWCVREGLLQADPTASI